MKKLVFMFVAMAAISFASCDNNDKAAQNADTTTVDTTTVDTSAVDTNTVDTNTVDTPAVK